MSIEIFTDGSSIGNGTKTSRAGCGVFIVDGESYSLSVSKVADLIKFEHSTKNTNNTGELFAILLALHAVKDKTLELIIYSDSMYCINSVCVWYKKWIQNGWISSTGSPVKNKEIIEAIILEKAKFKSVFFIHVKAHKTPPVDKNSKEFYLWNGNDKADMLAKTSIK